MMLRILVIAMAIAFSTTTLAEESKWRHKPVYCGSIPEVYEEIIDKNDLYPIMAAVGHVNSTYTPNTLLSPTVLYINSETKRLDNVRNENFVETFPELAELYE